VDLVVRLVEVQVADQQTAQLAGPRAIIEAQQEEDAIPQRQRVAALGAGVEERDVGGAGRLGDALARPRQRAARAPQRVPLQATVGDQVAGKGADRAQVGMDAVLGQS
jgi:hypothetical protein